RTTKQSKQPVTQFRPDLLLTYISRDRKLLPLFLKRSPEVASGRTRVMVAADFIRENTPMQLTTTALAILALLLLLYTARIDVTTVVLILAHFAYRGTVSTSSTGPNGHSLPAYTT